ncbi:hypothetical protein SAMN05216391_11650 [Lachnospiraceae bacterium KHCPX20]|nr:hypothetical protein SAMN05216391_11650 [Lachnospiraceae bacterium KHCPX20]
MNYTFLNHSNTANANPVNTNQGIICVMNDEGRQDAC